MKKLNLPIVPFLSTKPEENAFALCPQNNVKKSEVMYDIC